MAKTKAKATVDSGGGLLVKSPNLVTAVFRVYGTAPYVQSKFSGTKKDMMLNTQQQTKGTSRKAKSPRDIEADFEGSAHCSHDGRYGIPASAFRCALISACRVAGLVMTKAKLSIFCEAHALDETDGTGLVFLLTPSNNGKAIPIGKPVMALDHVLLQSGVASIAVRSRWNEWMADVPLKWDADQFSEQDVANLLERAGQQVGIGEGRPDSKKSNGMGWGTFSLMSTT